MTDLSKFSTQEELFKFLVENKKTLIAEKKFLMKEADAIFFTVPIVNEKGDVIKTDNQSIQSLLEKDSIKVKVVINTTNLLDSHNDVHIKGLWKKSLKEQKNIYLLQEHQMKFSNIITDDVSASVKTYTWKELGFDMDGDTEALVFDSTISKDRNPFMFEQYAKGYVKEHSVGMRYVSLEMCINSEEKYYKEEKEAWDKYYPEIANKEEADARGYFWAVTQAKIVEGSAVVKGSNYATPTISVKENNEPPKGTQENKDSRQQDTVTPDEFKNTILQILKN
jgi:hypothetical protein